MAGDLKKIELLLAQMSTRLFVFTESEMSAPCSK